MAFTSPASAARRNGVWPVKSTHASDPRRVTHERCGGNSRVPGGVRNRWVRENDVHPPSQIHRADAAS